MDQDQSQLDNPLIYSLLEFYDRKLSFIYL